MSFDLLIMLSNPQCSLNSHFRAHDTEQEAEDELATIMAANTTYGGPNTLYVFDVLRLYTPSQQVVVQRSSPANIDQSSV